MSEYCIEDGKRQQFPPVVVGRVRLTQEAMSDLAKLEEHRVVDPVTGGEKGAKLARFDLIPPEPMWALAEHYGKGAAKYGDRNYERGYNWSLNVAALQRHLNLWLRGEDNDSETHTNHLIAVAWHAFALFLFSARGLGTDDVRRKL